MKYLALFVLFIIALASAKDRLGSTSPLDEVSQHSKDNIANIQYRSLAKSTLILRSETKNLKEPYSVSSERLSQGPLKTSELFVLEKKEMVCIILTKIVF